MSSPYRTPVEADAAPESAMDFAARGIEETLMLIPSQYHGLVRIILERAVVLERHRLARLVMDHAMTMTRDTVNP